MVIVTVVTIPIADFRSKIIDLWKRQINRNYKSAVRNPKSEI
jgi:hypothetical protein